MELHTHTIESKLRNKIREMLTSILRTLVKNLIKESFDITFMGNEKNCQNINYLFFISHNFFF